MGGIGVWQILIVALVILVLFGRGRISEMMGDFGKGVSSFKKGLNDGPDEDAKPAENPQIKGPDATPTSAPSSETAKDSQPGDSAGN